MMPLLFALSLAVAQDQPAASILDSGSSVKALVSVRPFTLSEPATYAWVAEHPTYDHGWLVVLQVDPDMARARQVHVPVLYAGSIPVELTNVGWPSGMVVGIVPATVDLEHAPLYYGTETLPERVDAAYGASVLAAAGARGLRPRASAEWTAARALGGDVVQVADLGAVYRLAADLIDRYAPEEHERAENYRLTP